ncbi:MAG: NAD-dependent dehydratase, partial [Methylobacteriaceae bacterium]|nr:NAD-dependent dehydratase [Methylobacteriaceae bacterium]
MNEVTILGASGFIGSNLRRAVQAAGLPCYAPGRAEALRTGPLGTVFYCIGVTADFRTRPFDTVAAHVCRLSRVLQGCEFDALIYLSSTRVYGK